METVGFIGIGVMGQPMALNLVKDGVPLLVWNRTAERCERVRAAGAEVATTPEEVFENARVVILMMIDSAAMDAVLGRGSAQFSANVAGHLVVHMGTTSAEYSAALETDILNAGGQYVEAPVSGSRAPATAGQLVAMLAGADASTVEEVRQLIRPMCRESIICGPVPSALRMKLAVNLYMISMITALAEAVQFANRHGLDLSRFAAVLEAGPMDSPLARMKTKKLIDNDFEVQAAITDVLKNSRLVADAARTSGTASPLIDVCAELYDETMAMGLGAQDMVAVIRALEARTARES
ncbi:NAD(P)-dependent oxidoreductase [Kocuria sp. NPDC057446]|uniref:NAD(P)-dependent oxidoreductase n=1 Tax=Kocuria sp. NPDC057446 TaxID=3346137 RepID=UPI0036AC39F7